MKFIPNHEITDVYHPDYGLDGDYEEFFTVDGVWQMGNYYTMSMSHVLVRCHLGGTVAIPGFVEILSHQDRDGAFEGNLLVQKVIIPDSVTWINIRTFSECKNLEEVVIPNSVERIGAYAFHGCVSLEEITIPDSVTEIGDYAFAMYGANPYDHHPNPFDDDLRCTQDSKLTSIVLPASVTAIGEGAFSGNESLESVVLPKAITEIPDRCFCDCPRLVRIDIPDGVKRIGKLAFGVEQWWDNTSELKEIRIPNSVTEIGDKAFYGCDKLPEEARERILLINPNAFL